MSFPPIVHHVEKIPGSSEMRLARVTPYIRLVHRPDVKSGNTEVIYIHEGRLFYESGDEVPEGDIPDWFWRSAMKIKPKGLAKVRFKIPDEIATTMPPPPDKKISRAARGRSRQSEEKDVGT